MKVEELLKRYSSYKQAVINYERHQPIPAAGIANYSGMPSGSGAPELFFTRIGKPADMGNTSKQDQDDYFRYKRIVIEIEGALAILTDDQRAIVKLKWMHDITLKQISIRKFCSEKTIRKNHRIAMSRLNDALRFTELEEITVRK